ncbi:hypothetical protein CYY_003547 [Polysphondylium violaceum]|uniref:G domain-containing protein n=1 Tax=Polysphondylium violaceum TaxID=133409 RepID=A0A8J4PWN7_9MYCE|nr:hypothetical protein CYY_003547 [Polysphondylium violaceum]
MIKIITGNAGRGKSTLLNILVESNVFHSSISTDGSGVTKHAQVYSIGNSKFIDSPGLNDAHDKRRAAKEIKKCLQENINYKVVFVCNLESGRINDELTTVNIILNAIDMDKRNLYYGIIYNNVSKGVKDLYEKNGALLDIHLRQLPVPPREYVILERLGELEEGDNVLSSNQSFNYRLKKFIDSFSPTTFPKNSIKDIDPDTYDQIFTELEKRFYDYVQEKEEEIRILKQEVETKLNQSIKSIFEEYKQEVEKGIKKDGVVRYETTFRKVIPERITVQQKRVVDQTTYYKRLKIIKCNDTIEYTAWAEYNKMETEISIEDVEIHSEFSL